MKKRLLYIGQQKPLSDGIADHNTNYIKNLAKTKEIKITCIHNQKEIERIEGVNYIKFNPMNYKTLIKNYDIIHFQFGSSYNGDFVNLCFLLTPKNSKIKIVSTIHDFSNFTLSKYYRILNENPKSLLFSFYNVSIKKILKSSDNIIVYSNFFRDNIIRKYPRYGKKVKVILHGVDKPKYKKIKSPHRGEIKICSFGGITPRKGLEESINAIKRLQNEGYNISYDVYGYSPFKFYIKKLNKLIENNCIHLKEPIPDKEILEILRKYDLIIIPRRYTNEGGSGSLTFALASLVPVISVNTGSFKEYIVNGKTGFLVDHAVEGYYEIIKKIINGEIDLPKISKNVYAWIKDKISWAIICNNHVGVYLDKTKE